MPPQRRSGTWRAPSSVAHTCLIPSQPYLVLVYRPRKDGGLSKPRPRVKKQLAHGCYATASSQRDSNPRPRCRWSNTLTTRLSRHPSRHSIDLFMLLILCSRPTTIAKNYTNSGLPTMGNRGHKAAQPEKNVIWIRRLSGQWRTEEEVNGVRTLPIGAWLKK